MVSFRFRSKRWRAAAYLFVVMLTLAIYMKFFPSRVKFDSSTTEWDDLSSSEFNPTVDGSVNHTDLIWQLPAGAPKAVLFIAHGCNHRATDFWDNSSGCPHCIGLPEERLIVLKALRRGYAILVISSLRTCWSLGDEVESVERLIKWWIAEHRLQKLPLLGLGASSGGEFLSYLATSEQIKFRSIAILIAEGVIDTLTTLPVDYPPTIFVHMPKDAVMERSINGTLKFLRDNLNVPVKEIRCLEFPLTPELLSDRIPGLSRGVSVWLFRQFRKRGFIDDKGFMKNDGRETKWKSFLDDGVSIPAGYRSVVNNHLDHIEEELNLAFAYHEITSLEMDKIFRWFEVHMKSIN